MNDLPVESPLEEQEICVNCGLCCDGTLFSYAILEAGEQGSLPEKIEQTYGKEGEKEFFTLPCSYFCGKCTIYGQKRASICSAFRCQLLVNFSKSQITQPEAIKVVNKALMLKAEIYQLYRQTFGHDYTLSFREMLEDLGKFKSSIHENGSVDTPVEFLKAKCTIYETLLIKNFKSIKNFERMINISMD